MLLKFAPTPVRGYTNTNSNVLNIIPLWQRQNVVCIFFCFAKQERVKRVWTKRDVAVEYFLENTWSLRVCWRSLSERRRSLRGGYNSTHAVLASSPSTHLQSGDISLDCPLRLSKQWVKQDANTGAVKLTTGWVIENCIYFPHTHVFVFHFSATPKCYSQKSF